MKAHYIVTFTREARRTEDGARSICAILGDIPGMVVCGDDRYSVEVFVDEEQVPLLRQRAGLMCHVEAYEDLELIDSA